MTMTHGGKRPNAGRKRRVFRVELTPEEVTALTVACDRFNAWQAQHMPAQAPLDLDNYLQLTVAQELRQGRFDDMYAEETPDDQAVSDPQKRPDTPQDLQEFFEQFTDPEGFWEERGV